MISLINGNFEDAEGNMVSNGYLVLILSSDATTSSYKTIAAGIPITINLDANGDVLGTVNIWSNAELSPSDTYYSVMAFTSDNARAWRTAQTWVFAQGNGTIVDVADIYSYLK